MSAAKPPKIAPLLVNDLAALSLLRCAPFSWSGGVFSWRDDSLAANLMQGRADDLPRSLTALTARLDDEGRAARKAAMRALTWDGAQYRAQYQARQFNGANIWIEERGQRLAGNGKTPAHIEGVLRDISLEKAAEQSAHYRASFDPLTGLWNEARMGEALKWLIAACQRYQRSGVFFTLQVSNIEEINASYGYEAGDRLLTGIAQRILSHVRAPDATARLSGHGFDGIVFGIAIGECDEGGQAAMAERLIGELTDTPYPSPHGDLYASFAISAVQIPAQINSAMEAMDCARIALDHSLAREGIYVAYEDGMEDLSARRRRAPITEGDILGALNSRSITLAYQPLVHATTREPHHYECLLRLRRPDGQIVPAGEFIMAAERLGLVHFLDRRALEIASETLRNVDDIELALNVSAATVKNELAAADYISALKALGPMASRVSIELTETVALDDPAMAAGFSSAVRALGCTFSIDDFGAGYTTFQNLMAIEADEIKIDGSFITDLSVTPHKQTFVRMMVDLAQTFNVKTVAEFVNTPQDADLLTRLGVDYLQGYMFGVPNTSPDWQSAKTGKQPPIAKRRPSG